MDQDVTARVIIVVAGHIDRKPEDITTASTYEGLGFDSLDNIEVVMLCEEEFGIELSDNIISNTATIGGLVQAVEEARNAQNAKT